MFGNTQGKRERKKKDYGSDYEENETIPSSNDLKEIRICGDIFIGNVQRGT